jgi:carbonic anhydrase/acetyltransferase-like protein (isoleucine patch superfamily)
MSNQFTKGFLQRVQVSFFAPFFRRVGKTMYYFGKGLQAETASSDRILPSPNAIEVRGQTPKVSNSIFIGPNTTIVGDVQFGKNCSVFFASNLKTDGSNSNIKIGDGSIIHDLVTIKAEKNGSVVIGQNCFIASNAHIINSTIEDNVFVGIGAYIPENCRIEKNSYVAAGAKLQPGTVVKSNEMWECAVGRHLPRTRQQTLKRLRGLLGSLQARRLRHLYQ